MAFELPLGEPLPDLGLKCQSCAYPLAGVTKRVCPECGWAFELDDLIPEGAFPPLIADGEMVRATDELEELMQAYDVPLVRMQDPLNDVFGNTFIPGVSQGSQGVRVAVPRDRWLEAVDLVRRWRQNEELPLPPDPPDLDAPDWTCPHCGEDNPGHFEVCWNCMSERPV
ncbi:MAG: hypothetical protein AAF823_00380 [Planctomycetota bacterium]